MTNYFSVVGAEVECVDKCGNTPLHAAAKHGHELLVGLLLNNGADVARCVFTHHINTQTTRVEQTL